MPRFQVVYMMQGAVICTLRAQTVQYIDPKHHARLAAAELLIIDEAAAIPLPLVQALLGPYLVFLCSTVNGYEGMSHALCPYPGVTMPPCTRAAHRP